MFMPRINKAFQISNVTTKGWQMKRGVNAADTSRLPLVVTAERTAHEYTILITTCITSSAASSCPDKHNTYIYIYIY